MNTVTKMRFLVVFSVASTAAGQFNARAETIVLQPGPEAKDTYIDNRSREGKFDQNFGSEDRLLVGHSDTSNANLLAAIVEFDVAQLPASGVVSVIIALTIRPVPDGTGTPATVAVHAVTSSWDENSVTWNTQPSVDPEPADSREVQNALGEQVEWDITPLYLAWKSGAVANNGLSFVITSDNNGEGFSFVSSDSTDAASLRPFLLLETEPAPEFNFIRGDVNASSTVDVSDAVTMLIHLFLQPSAIGCPDANDANDDGKLTLMDAIFLLAHLFLGNHAPALPEPVACGDDPTPDDLADCITSGCGP